MEQQISKTMRPFSFDDIIGQEEMVKIVTYSHHLRGGGFSFEPT